MDHTDDHPAPGVDECREPTLADLVKLCAELNARGAKYLVVGGFAIRAHGYVRNTMDVDLLIDTSLENEASVRGALTILPDQACLQMEPGEVAHYGVVRIGDEIMVDLMKSACGIDYATAICDAVVLEVGGVAIPFASAPMLWRMKSRTHREKDLPDLVFLRRLLAQQGMEPPA